MAGPYLVKVGIDGVQVGDHVTLNANASGQRYWVYFRPQPTGLDAATVAELQRMLRVRLCTREGKELAILPLTNTLVDIDPKTGFTARRGRKLMLGRATIGGALIALASYWRRQWTSLVNGSQRRIKVPAPGKIVYHDTGQTEKQAEKVLEFLVNGRVVATERRPNTPHEFHFWTALDSPVGIGTIVRVDGNNPVDGQIPHIYGIVVEGFSYTDLQTPLHDVLGHDGDPDDRDPRRQRLGDPRAEALDVARGALRPDAPARPDDARRCVQAGVRAIWVSNHGGRQLDRAAARDGHGQTAATAGVGHGHHGDAGQPRSRPIRTIRPSSSASSAADGRCGRSAMSRGAQIAVIGKGTPDDELADQPVGVICSNGTRAEYRHVREG